MLLELSGYVGTAETQPESCISMLQFMYLWLPLIFDVLIMLVLSRINVEEANDKIRAKKEWYQEILSLFDNYARYIWLK